MAPLQHLWALWTLLFNLFWFRVSDGSSFGFCQMYSYNIKDRHSGIEEKHFFTCCNNVDEKTCQGWTYQKAERKESFCSGHVVHKSGSSHWTIMETSAFPNQGRFYCGGCCGQHLAMEACNQKIKDGAFPKCMNWAQCFQKECRNVVAAVLANQPLRCTVPPPPYPKHYVQEPRTLPAEFNLTTTKATTDRNHLPLQKNRTCTEEWCQALQLTTRCQTSCCQDYCCLPDGKIPGTGSFWGLTTIQIVGIALAIILFLIGFIVLGLFVIRRCIPGCRNFKSISTDTQILVIEGPEDVESCTLNSDSDDLDSS